MLSRTLNQINQSPWAKLVWAGVCVLALLQMVAFYKLCSSQVDRAHARESVAVEQRNALTDCLDYMNSSTISSCVRHAAGSRSAADDAGSLASRDMPHVRPAQAVLGSVVPVSYVFH
ncbi:hypothetical protein ACFPOE_13160 [Caenimonas terrae]|uniref:Uncharacterized protein n=1 Tax=Caenimonas terrae TaxID=696074 RepID=A0ABW0NH67_9BURK